MVQFFGIYIQDEQEYIVTEFLDCGSVKDLLNREVLSTNQLVGMYDFFYAYILLYRVGQKTLRLVWLIWNLKMYYTETWH